jgi:UDP-glucuronate 4-epimerase
MKYLVTGVAGFIGSNVAKSLLASGHHVVGIDSMNDYYDVALKKYRLTYFIGKSNFTFVEMNIADRHAVLNCSPLSSLTL